MRTRSVAASCVAGLVYWAVALVTCFATGAALGSLWRAFDLGWRLAAIAMRWPS